jgi:Protein of unknown function (DUF1403)
LALWLADAVLAARLKWPRPLPLIAGALVHPSLRAVSARRSRWTGIFSPCRGGAGRAGAGI